MEMAVQGEYAMNSSVFGNCDKGGHPDVTRTLRAIPGIQGIWQVHKNLNTTDDMNTKLEMIANMDEKCQGEFIHLSVAADGKSFTVQIGEHGKPVRYETRLP